jgi:hypothetical protein
MQFCQGHWDKLKTEIHSLGLGQFIAGSEEEMGRKLSAQADAPGGAPSKNTFDPLMNAFMAITQRALEVGGIGLMIELQTPPNPECPLCFMQQVHEQGCKIEGCTFTYEAWIGYAAKDQLDYAKSMGIVGEA